MTEKQREEVGQGGRLPDLLLCLETKDEDNLS